MKQRCDDLFYTIVMNIKVKRILEEEKMQDGIDRCGLLLLRCHVMRVTSCPVLAAVNTSSEKRCKITRTRELKNDARE